MVCKTVAIVAHRVRLSGLGLGYAQGSMESAIVFDTINKAYKKVLASMAARIKLTYYMVLYDNGLVGQIVDLQARVRIPLGSFKFLSLIKLSGGTDRSLSPVWLSFLRFLTYNKNLFAPIT